MLTNFRNLFRRTPAPAGFRNFSASTSGRLSADWITAPLSADAAMRGHIGTIRDRSRDMERNNEWTRGFLRTLENNVIGSAGIALQLRVKDPVTGRMDEIANDRIETAWWQWGRKGNCTLCGRHTWRDVQKLIIRTIARDGEVVLRKVVTKTGLKIQLLEADLLDTDAHFTHTTGNQVRFGVELDAGRSVSAYWLLGHHPGDGDFQSPVRKSIRIPADEIIHLYLTERIDQTRGLPWLIASMKALKMLAGYAEAELVAARTGAAKMGFFQKKTPDGWAGEVDGEGNLTMDASPGTIEELPAGVEFKAWDSDHPNAGYGEFVKSQLRGVATSLGISYNTLSSDLEGVNYSSIRAGLLEEREVWKGLQTFLIEHLCEPLFSHWLEIELITGRLGLPVEKIWKFNVPEFQGRRWSWVDPKKDMEAAIMGIRSGLTSARKVIAEGGGDIYDVYASQKADNDLAKQHGLTFPELVDAPKGPFDSGDVDTED